MAPETTRGRLIFSRRTGTGPLPTRPALVSGSFLRKTLIAVCWRTLTKARNQTFQRRSTRHRQPQPSRKARQHKPLVLPSLRRLWWRRLRIRRRPCLQIDGWRGERWSPSSDPTPRTVCTRKPWKPTKWRPPRLTEVLASATWTGVEQGQPLRIVDQSLNHRNPGKASSPPGSVLAAEGPAPFPGILGRLTSRMEALGRRIEISRQSEMPIRKRRKRR
mmetsp:Transcript_36476/g.79837  ORF Transcript_36476/g.79837 Transcript_36476/m.79837 type:complete len:218 (-) Transcript_36476:473-1126(-)